MRKPALLAVLLVFGALFLALAWPGAGERGIVAEEVQPHLHRYPIVLTRVASSARGREGPADAEPRLTPNPGGGAGDQSPEAGPRPPSIVPTPPYEEGAPARPRWVATSQWPVVAYDGEARMWPVFIRGHQTALGSYVNIAIGSILGGGIAGIRRSTVLVALAMVLLTGLMAARMHGGAPGSALAEGRPGARRRAGVVAWTAALLASSFGMISIARTGYAFEVGSRALMMLALAGLAPRAPPSLGRAAWVGAACGVAILCRGTIVIALAPALVVLCLSDERRPSRAALAWIAGLGFVLPLLLVAGFSLAVPFQAGSAPLSGFPLERIPARMLAVHRQLILSLAWLGDATSVWGPLHRGETSLDSVLWLPAAMAWVPLAAAVVRLVRGHAGEGEKLFAAALVSSVVFGALLYEGPNQFQLALGLESFFALAIADQITAIADAPRGSTFGAASGRIGALCVGALVIALRAGSTYRGLALDATTANPMLSGKAQRAAVARMTELELTGPEVVTTVYNHAGVIEGWTGGAIRPLHAWPVLSSRPTGADCPLQASWREIFRVYRPRFVLLTEGPNLYESGGMDPPAIARSLRRAAEVVGITVNDDRRFPTESGGAGWALLHLRYPKSLLAPGRDELAVDPACVETPMEAPAGEPLAAWNGLSAGVQVGALQIQSIERHHGMVQITARRKDDVAMFEVRPEGAGPAPPAAGGGYGVYYRNRDTRVFKSEELVAAAASIADELAKANPSVPPGPSRGLQPF